MVVGSKAVAAEPTRSAPAGGGGRPAPAAPAPPPRSAPATPANNANAQKSTNSNNDTSSRSQPARENKANEQARSGERNDRRFDRNRTVVVLPWSNYYGWGYWSSPRYWPYY